MSTSQTGRFLSIDELALQSGLSVSTLRRRVKDGSLPFVQPGGRRTRMAFSADVLERLMTVAAQHIEPSNSTAPSTPTAFADRAPRHEIPGPRPRWMADSLPKTRR